MSYFMIMMTYLMKLDGSYIHAAGVKGYASYLTKLLIEKAFEINKEVVIECDPKQEATKHIALKYGFQYEGVEDDLEVYRLRKNDISLL